MKSDEKVSAEPRGLRRGHEKININKYKQRVKSVQTSDNPFEHLEVQSLALRARNSE